LQWKQVATWTSTQMDMELCFFVSSLAVFVNPTAIKMENSQLFDELIHSNLDFTSLLLLNSS